MPLPILPKRYCDPASLVKSKAGSAGFVSNPILFFFFQILKGAGAKEDLADALGQTPQFYLENKASGQLDLKVYSLLILVLLRYFWGDFIQCFNAKLRKNKAGYTAGPSQTVGQGQ